MDFSHLDDPEDRPAPPGTLDNIVARARRVQRRRRVLMASASAIVLVVAGIAAAQTVDRRHVVVATTPPSTATTTPPEPSTTLAPVATVASTTTTTTTRPAAPTTARPRYTTSTTSTRTTTTAPEGDCSSSDLRVTAVTDKSSYPTGATVTITVRVTNQSGHTCNRPHACMSRVASVADPSDGIVWDQPYGPPGMCAFQPPEPVNPGETFDYATVAWDQHSCTDECARNTGGQKTEGPQVPAGTYHAVGHVLTTDGGLVDGSGPNFTIT